MKVQGLRKVTMVCRIRFDAVRCLCGSLQTVGCHPVRMRFRNGTENLPSFGRPRSFPSQPKKEMVICSY
jgi:hypothetical protein